MVYCCESKRAAVLWSIMLVIACLCLFVSFGAVELSPQRLTSNRLRQKQQPFDDSSKELLLVHAVFRHGPRTPADTYPNDPHFNETFHPYGWGQITNDGKKRLYETGQWLRQRYGNFLGREYTPDLLHAQTTGVTRTKVSMATVLAGLFPPKNTALEWNRSLNWQPIAIDSEKLEEDSLLLVRTPCPRYYEALEEVFQLPEVKQVFEENAELFKELTEHTGMDIKTPDDVQSLYSTLRAETEYGLKLPAWTKKYYPERLVDLTDQSYIYNVYTDELKKFKAGPFLKKLIAEQKNKIDSTLKPAGRKIFLYTGHDSTIVNVLSGVNVWTKQFPTYAIMGIFELVRDKKSGEVGVQIYLRNSPTSGAIPLTIPGCEHFCPFDKFVQLTDNVIAKNFDEECKPKNKDFTTPPPSGP